jgi:predicted chitinase
MSLFKEPFAGEIANQLAARQHLISKENRSSTDLAYLNSKTAWVQLRSSVDIVVPSGNSSNLAMNNVLANGTLGAFGMKRGVGSYLTSAYSHQTYNASLKTEENNIMGIRPMPGITNMSIQNKGAYGSLRQATVTFQCWDIKQLDILEQLYMRPGYTVLLEWGWNPYIDNTGKLVNLQNQDNKFFTRKDIQLQDYLSDLRKRSLDSHGNYDSMFGYIMNYGWKYRGDGGYDCTTEIISTGEILESYKINFSGAPIIAKDTPTKLFSGVQYSDSTNIKSEYAKNVLTGLIYETYTACKTQFESTGGQTMGIGNFEYDYKDKKGVVSYAVSNVAVEIPGTVTDEDGTETIPTDTSGTSGNVLDPGKDIYVTLESFVGLINNFILLQNPSDKVNKRIMDLSVNDRPDVGKAGNPLYCLTHPLQISVDPSVCVIRNDAFVKNISNIKITTSPITTVDSSAPKIPFTAPPVPAKTPIDPKTLNDQFKVENMFGKEIEQAKIEKIAADDAKTTAAIASSEGYLKFCGMLRPFYKNLFNKELGEQSEIYLNLRYLYNLALDSTLKSQDPAEKDGIQLIPYIKNILSAVQTATGNVNNFEIIIDGQSGYIVDLNHINLGEVKPFTFNISGKNSILRDIQFESQIFADQASIIAISAQSDAGKLGLENSSMVAFNNGIRDRMISKKDSPISSQKDPITQLEGFVTALADIKIFLDAFNNLTDAKLKSEQIGSFKTSLTEVIAFATTVYKSSSNKYKSILPTKVSLTFDGIGGIIIGNIFNIDKTFTPSSYKGDGSGIDLQYTVTNVSHTIGTDNQWKTTIQGNPFIPDSSSKNLDTGLTNLSTVGFEINLSIEYDQATQTYNRKISTKKLHSTYSPVSKQAAKGLATFQSELKKSGFTPTVQTAILSKAMTESGGVKLKENINYSNKTPDEMKAIFGARLAGKSDDFINNLTSNPNKMVGFLYGPNSNTGLGNLSEADAVKYIGRGYIGITGRANYAAVSKAIYGNENTLLNNPELLEKPEIAAKASAAFLKLNTPNMAKKMGISVNTATQDQANQLLVNTIGGTGVRNLTKNDVYGDLYRATTSYSQDPTILALVKN